MVQHRHLPFSCLISQVYPVRSHRLSCFFRSQNRMIILPSGSRIKRPSECSEVPHFRPVPVVPFIASLFKALSWNLGLPALRGSGWGLSLPFPVRPVPVFFFVARDRGLVFPCQGTCVPFFGPSRLYGGIARCLIAARAELMQTPLSPLLLLLGACPWVLQDFSLCARTFGHLDAIAESLPMWLDSTHVEFLAARVIQISHFYRCLWFLSIFLSSFAVRNSI